MNKYKLFKAVQCFMPTHATDKQVYLVADFFQKTHDRTHRRYCHC